MTSGEELAIARMLRVALGYESREVKIGNLKNSPFLDVRQIMARLDARGLIGEASVKDVFGVPPIERRKEPR